MFLANFFAILFAGSLTFMILGPGKVAQKEVQLRYRKRSFVLIILGTLLVAISYACRLPRNMISNIIVKIGNVHHAPKDLSAVQTPDHIL